MPLTVAIGVMTRKTLKDWTLSDGTTLPAGTYIGIAADAMSKSEVRFTAILLEAKRSLCLTPLYRLYSKMQKHSKVLGSRKCVTEMMNGIPSNTSTSVYTTITLFLAMVDMLGA